MSGQEPDLMERVIQSFADDLEQKAQRAAAEQGQPLGTRRVTESKAIRDYGIRDPNADPAVIGPLLKTGLPPELLNPQSPTALMIAKLEPDLVPYFQQPAATPEAAATLAAIAEYPFRWGHVMSVDDPEERVRYADHLDREWQKTLPAPAETPISVQPPAMRPPTPVQPAPPDDGKDWSY